MNQSAARKVILPRRRFLFGLAAALAAPAIVRVESIMPVRAIVQPFSAGVLEVIGLDGEVERIFHLNHSNVHKVIGAQRVNYTLRT